MNLAGAYRGSTATARWNQRTASGELPNSLLATPRRLLVTAESGSIRSAASKCEIASADPPLPCKALPSTSCAIQLSFATRRACEKRVSVVRHTATWFRATQAKEITIAARTPPSASRRAGTRWRQFRPASRAR